MAIRKLPSGNYQARLEGLDGRILSKTFPCKVEARRQVLDWQTEKRKGMNSSSIGRSVQQFYLEWSTLTLQDTKSGWISIQKQHYRDYISPVISHKQLDQVQPNDIRKILNRARSMGKSPQLCRHIYVLLRKFFNDAIEDYHYITHNPALRKLQPALQYQEAKHLNLTQSRTLLKLVDNRDYGLAIWTQLFLGLRVGELIALKWEDLDLEYGRVKICRTYVKKTHQIREYPKGKKHHRHSLPAELWEKLRKTSKDSEFVFHSPKGTKFLLPYRWYQTALKKYCREAGVPIIGTHGLRHSTSEIFLQSGATPDDLRELFAHSTPSTTRRYIHGRGTNLETVINRVKLFDSESTTKP